MPDYQDTTRAKIVFGLRTFAAGPAPLPAELSYDTSDPYAVAVNFHTGRGTVQWMCARDLLADGLLAPAGLGDLRISPATDPEFVVFELITPDGEAVMEAPSAEIAAFLDRTYEKIPAGSEHQWFDFEHELGKLTSHS
ncbi:SsgA family sporulation/cell division regulator [Amycolatopsis lurida]|uniref:SsgA family sporulation/cell division regulator n=1 Tax=Amycolatopsis sp. YIM 10 TaxID=2653857 RepID=UPI00128FCFC7|nr:SsgA family sporulation/cell division regulator [Amycolatopsis sp. YIM 10]QFU86957.1 Sporulation and cell division protein [Amycolatopsis sp. YIM 10]